MSRRIIVVGGGFMGESIVARLCELGATVVVLEDGTSPGFADICANYGAIPIPGDPHSANTLLEAGLLQAHCVLTVSDNDSINLEVALKAQKLHPDVRVILRMFDVPLAGRIEKAFGIRSLSSSALAAPAFVSAALGSSVSASLAVEGHRIMVYAEDPFLPHAERWHMMKDGSFTQDDAKDVELTFWAICTHEHGRRKRHPRRKPWRKHRISRDIKQWWDQTRRSWRSISPITRGMFLAALFIMSFSVLVFTVYGHMSPLDATYFVVTTLTTVGYGDLNLQHAPTGLKIYGIIMMFSGAAMLATIYAIVADRVLATRVEFLLGLRGVRGVGHAVIVGLGKVGFRTATEMHALGVDVIAIEPHADTENVAEARTHFPVVVGDASRTDVLLRACVERADMILALTNNTVLNLDVALRAKELNPKIRTILRTHEPALAEHFRELGLDAVVSTAAIAAPAFADAALSADVVATFDVCDKVMQLVKEPVSNTYHDRIVMMVEHGADAYRRFEPGDKMPDQGQVYAIRALNNRDTDDD